MRFLCVVRLGVLGLTAVQQVAGFAGRTEEGGGEGGGGRAQPGTTGVSAAEGGEQKSHVEETVAESFPKSDQTNLQKVQNRCRPGAGEVQLLHTLPRTRSYRRFQCEPSSGHAVTSHCGRTGISLNCH